MLRLRSIPLACLLLTSLASVACGDDGGGNEAPGSETSAGDGDGDATAGDGDGDGDGDTGPDFGDCGNGVVDAGEICDDGNNVTEYPPYAASDCIDDCSMVLATCNDGNVDPGEDCDDGNADSKDMCTTSCTPNTMAVHAACTVLDPDGMELDPQFNITDGDIQNCDNAMPPTGAAVGCNRSWEYIGMNRVYAPGGDCQIISLKCDGDLCPAGPIGDYDMHTECPAGHVMIDKLIDGGGVIPNIHSKVCLLACESDRDCRWNETDTKWMGPGEFRCSTTPLSNGARVCNDARNNAL